MKLPFYNMQIKHWNPDATMPLILPLHLVCNTSDEEILANIRINSAVRREWIKSEPAHGRIAVLCGSGPSLGDTLEEIGAFTGANVDVFAMNGAATFLEKNWITPDYQVIIDARRETSNLIEPACFGHLFASQVHPDCFALVPNAQLWHLQIGNIESVFPEYSNPYALIGGAASVGNTSLCLAYVLGYRTIHCFGFDSSHRNGESHAFHQKMNEGEPTCVVEFHGQTYTTSLTMKLQAEKFLDTAKAVKSMGTEIFVHGTGLLPDLYNSDFEVSEEALELSERAKYETMWHMPIYREEAPGEKCVEDAFSKLAMVREDTLLDFGCGTGRAAKEFQKRGIRVTGIDFSSNCLDPDSLDIPFVEACLWKLPDITADWGFCTDVMEHIPEDKVDEVLSGIAVRTRGAYFQISTVPDSLGELIGEKLHMVVESPEWWKSKLLRHWPNVTMKESPGIVTLVVLN